ncbi:MAG: hypothetical protein RR942_03460 [Romboutsia sp.]
MKKIWCIFIIIGVLALMGCTKKEDIIIDKEIVEPKEQIKERLSGNSIGIYSVANLDKGIYRVSIMSEEYNDGKFKKSIGVLDSEIEIKNNKGNLNVGINKTDNNKLVFDISQNDKSEFMATTSQGMDLSKINIENSGSTWNMLENASEGVNKIELGKNLAIASFSAGEKGVTYGIKLGNNFIKPSEADADVPDNMVDIIIYLKISKI